MARRVFRILLILVLAALAGVTGWQVWSLDRTRTQQRDDSARLQREALRVSQALLDLRASQRAYLSPGQGIASWKPRVDAHLATLRDQFHALREQASASVSPFATAAAQADDEAIDALAALKTLEQRVSEHVTEGRIQHAADLVYADGVRISLTLERAANAAFTAHAQELDARRTRVQWTEGALLALAAAIGFVLALLMIPGRQARTEAATAAADDAARATGDKAGAADTAGAGHATEAGARTTGRTGRRSEPAVQGLGLSSGGRAAAGAATASAGMTGGAGAGAAATAGRGVTTPMTTGAAGGRITPTSVPGAAASAANVLDDLPLHAPAAAYASAAASGAKGRDRRDTFAGAGVGTGAGAGGTGTAAVSGTGAATTSTHGTVTAAGASAVAMESASGRSTPVSSMAVHTQEGLLAAAAELTVSVARAGDVDGLRPVLARLAEHLDAVGIIVWLEDASTQRLTPIVTHGYPAETLAHLPAIDLDADNATARAWRLAELQIVAGRGAQPGAIVVPMPSSAGCVGVIAAEVRHGREHDPATLALARILAAQLAMLTGARG
jgi:hypothetical protein